MFGNMASRREIDTTVPHIARVYDYWLGGTSNYEVDREAATRAAEANPVVLQGVHGNRAFLARSVRYLAGAGIRQFLDIGAGIPNKGNTHEIARSVAPEARVAYVDNDPVVFDAADSVLAPAVDGLAYIEADVRDVTTVIAQAGQVLDFSQPTGVLMIAVLHCVPDAGDPWAVARQIMRAVPPGSYLALTHPSYDWHPERAAAGVSRLNAMMAQQLTFRPREQVLRFFDGLELVPPGLVRAPEWRPDSGAESANPAEMWGGVGLRPGG
jgi:SAM-dependent methyltransferase